MEKKLLLALVGLGFILTLLLGYNLRNQDPNLGQAAPGTEATVATTSVSIFTAGGVNTLFATSTCTARIVSTTAAASLMLIFTDNQGIVPTATLGHFQPASSTVVYDAGLYGCDKVKAFSHSVQTITVTEVR